MNRKMLGQKIISSTLFFLDWVLLLKGDKLFHKSFLFYSREFTSGSQSSSIKEVRQELQSLKKNKNTTINTNGRNMINCDQREEQKEKQSNYCISAKSYWISDHNQGRNNLFIQNYTIKKLNPFTHALHLQCLKRTLKY